MSRLVVISPHLDDAVFSCGTMLAAHSLDAESPLVITVFAGPPPAGVLTQLDAAAGFPSSAAAVAMRRMEDVRACALLGANVLHLDLLDAQYNTGDAAMTGEQRRNQVRVALAHVLANNDWRVLAPVGIRHVDHQHVAAVCRDSAALWYAELPYRVMDAGGVAASFGEDATFAKALALPWSEAKDRAVRCYASQLGDGPPGPELLEQEWYYRTPDWHHRA